MKLTLTLSVGWFGDTVFLQILLKEQDKMKLMESQDTDKEGEVAVSEDKEEEQRPYYSQHTVAHPQN